MEMEQMVSMLNMSQLEIASLRIANQTLRERIQWLEHLCSEYQEQLEHLSGNTESHEKKDPIGFNRKDERKE
jgi:hypothetical protein